jgi:hypothetical protein
MTLCPGQWERLRNVCPCSQCRDLEALRSQYIGAVERVSRLSNQGAPMAQIVAAEIAREQAGEAWRAAVERYEQDDTPARRVAS